MADASPRRRVGTKGRKRAGAILDAAHATLLSAGHAGFSLRSVATDVGVRLGHLQYYYPQKQELLHAVVERELARLATAVESRLEISKGQTADGQPGWVAAMLDIQREPNTIRLLGELRALALRDRRVDELLRGYTARCWRAVVGALRAASPGLRRPRAERRAALVVALLEGLMMFRAPARPDELPLPGVERELAELGTHLAEP